MLLTKYSAYTNAQTLDPTQVYTTPNIVQQTTAGSNTTPWVNGVYQNNLTCWSWGNPGYCGPNAIVRPGNNINFSYGTTDLYQIQAIANALPNSGTGLRINGYNFSFTAKNGNGWDDGRVDVLSAYVNFYDPSGKLVKGDNYNLTYKFNWTSFNFNQTFDNPYATKDLGNVRYGFVGRDNNFWAGPYGPEVYNVSFSLKYSVDPCSVDVLSSSTCPGYLDALAKLSPPKTTTTYEPTSTLPTITATPSVSTTTTEPVVSSSVSISTPSNLSANATTAIVSATPTALNPQPKVGEVAQSSAPKSTVSTSQILSIVANEQSRIGNVEKTVVQEAVQQAQAAGSAATAQAEAIAASSQAQSIASSNLQQNSNGTQSNSGQRSQSQLFSISSIRENNPTSLASLNAAREQSLSSSTDTQVSNDINTVSQGIQVSLVSPTNIQQSNRNVEIPVVSSVVLPQISYSLSTQKQPVIDTEIKSEGIKFGERNILDNATEKTMQIETPNQQQVGSAVKKNIKDNDAAGGVTLASIAKQPVGYESYFGALSDRQFYAPKEIYKNQKIVDNARILRGLTGGSDKLHQEMVNQQYKIGN